MDGINFSDISQATFELNNAVTTAETADEKRQLIENYLKKFDFPSTRCYLPEIKDLQWLNVNRSLNFDTDFKGKIVVLDFFTYCCINCIHLLPYLDALEKKYTYSDGLAVVGVHSGKFDNERLSENVLKAISKLHIEHPVINDEESYLWNKLSIMCWPTIFIIGPEQQILFIFIGESFKDQLELYTNITLSYYKKQNRINNSTASFTMQNWKTSTEILNFPGKISCNPTEELLAVSDSGNHRILIISKNGVIQVSVGGIEAGFVDGKFSSSRFRSPQGVTWTAMDIICVADTENHAIREINLKTKLVRTLYRTNLIEKNENMMLSPWDVVYFSNIQDEVLKNVLLIAAAGSHQIWAYFFEDTFMLNKNYLSGECALIAGNGKEENRNNTYPHKAGFAQPSGLTVCELNGDHKLLIADSESSSIRLMSLDSGKVMGIVGGERDPLNLFGFGDKDGEGINVKLQHPMGIVWNEKNSLAYIADTYNHKIKIVDLIRKTCTTFDEEAEFDEPNGLTFNPRNSILYITDTNNHKIKTLNLDNKEIKTLGVRWKSRQFRLQPNHIVNCKPTAINPNQSVQIHIRITPPNGVNINTEAPNAAKVFVQNELATNVEMKLDKDTSVSLKYELSCFKDCSLESSSTIEMETEIYCCENGSCYKRIIVFRLPITVINLLKDIDPLIHVDYTIPSESFSRQ